MNINSIGGDVTSLLFEVIDVIVVVAVVGVVNIINYNTNANSML